MFLVAAAGWFQREGDQTLVVPEEVVVQVEEVLAGGAEDRVYSTAVGDVWVIPAGWVVVRMVQEGEGSHERKDQGEAVQEGEGSRERKDRVEVDQEVEGWDQVSGGEPPAGVRIGSRLDG